MRANVRSRGIALAMLAVAIGACSDRLIQVEITDSADREKYIEVLQKNSLEYTIDARGRILVKADSFDELDAKMKEYNDWRNARLKSQAVVVPKS